MATAAWPSVVAALVTTAKAAAPSVRVVRGRTLSDDPGNFVMVGVQSMDDSPGWESPGSFDQEFQAFGGSRLETGTVNGLAFSRNGAADQAVAEAAAFALIDALAAAVRTDPSLGITTFDYLVAQFHGGAVQESQNTNDGAVTALSFSISYEARITA